VSVGGFSPGEWDDIRRAFDMFFSTLPTVAEGFSLKTWRSVPEADMPALSPVARTPRRDTTGRITNAVLILHGTSGTARNLLAPGFADEIFALGKPLDVGCGGSLRLDRW
jgi:hypothetical protein